MGCLFRVCYVVLSVRHLADEERWTESWFFLLVQWIVVCNFDNLGSYLLFKVINWIVSINVVFYPSISPTE